MQFAINDGGSAATMTMAARLDIAGAEVVALQPLKHLAAQVRAFESGRPAFDHMAALMLSLEPQFGRRQ